MPNAPLVFVGNHALLLCKTRLKTVYSTCTTRAQNNSLYPVGNWWVIRHVKKISAFTHFCTRTVYSLAHSFFKHSTAVSQLLVHTIHIDNKDSDKVFLRNFINRSQP